MIRHFFVLQLMIVALLGCKAPGVELQPHQQLGGQPDQVPITEDPPATAKPTDVTPSQGTTPLTATASTTVPQQPGRVQPVAKTSIPTVSAGSTVLPNDGDQTAASSGGVSPQIVSFTASPAQVNPGDTVTLSWKSIGSSAEIGECLSPDDGHLFRPCTPSSYVPVPLVGTRTVTVPKNARYHVSFILVAKSSAESQPEADKYQTMSVEVTCPTTWFFGAAPETDTSCPKEEVVTSAAAWQTLEHGSMMWKESTHDIAVFFGDGHMGGGADQWNSSMPESDPNIVPPEGLYQPVRGFGLIWRELRDTLGWATAPEFSFQVVYQCSVYRFHESNCYYRDPNGRIIGTDFFMGWRVVKQ